MSGFGTDAPAIDAGVEVVGPGLRAAFLGDRYAVVQLGNLDRLPPLGGTVVVAPRLEPKGGRSTARVLAVVPR